MPSLRETAASDDPTCNRVHSDRHVTPLSPCHQLHAKLRCASGLYFVDKQWPFIDLLTIVQRFAVRSFVCYKMQTGPRTSTANNSHQHAWRICPLDFARCTQRAATVCLPPLPTRPGRRPSSPSSLTCAWGGCPCPCLPTGRPWSRGRCRPAAPRRCSEGASQAPYRNSPSASSHTHSPSSDHIKLTICIN